MNPIEAAIKKHQEAEEARIAKEEAERKKSFEAKQERMRLDNLARQKADLEKPITTTEFQIIGRAYNLVVVTKRDDDKNISEIFVRTGGRTIPLEVVSENFIA
jgi:hypothetical protein